MNTISPLDRSKHLAELNEAQFHFERLRTILQAEVELTEEVINIVATSSAKVVVAVHEAEKCVNETFNNSHVVMLYGVKITKAEFGMEVLTLEAFIERMDRSAMICGAKPIEVCIDENCWDALLADAGKLNVKATKEV